jgi:hypothetical protein
LSLIFSYFFFVFLILYRRPFCSQRRLLKSMYPCLYISTNPSNHLSIPLYYDPHITSSTPLSPNNFLPHFLLQLKSQDAQPSWRAKKRKWSSSLTQM